MRQPTAMVAQVKPPDAAAGEAAPSQSMAQHVPPRLLAGASPAAEAGAAPGTGYSAPAAAGAADADGEWVGGAADDEADDEGTLEEEEVPLSSSAFTRCHARDRHISNSSAKALPTVSSACAQALAEATGEGTAQHAAEVSALADEADMPLDQLLAQYGYVVGEDGRKRSADDAHVLEDDSSSSHGKPPCWDRLANITCKQMSVATSLRAQVWRS